MATIQEMKQELTAKAEAYKLKQQQQRQQVLDSLDAKMNAMREREAQAKVVVNEAHNAFTTNASYRDLQRMGKELRELGYEVGKLNACYSVLQRNVELAQEKRQAHLKEMNERSVFGNQKPVHQAGTRKNLMERSKARQERQGAPVNSQAYKELNKKFNKEVASLSGVQSTERKPASNAFNYKQMHLELSLMSNGAPV